MIEVETITTPQTGGDEKHGAALYKTKIERVRGLDGAPRHKFLWDVTAASGSKRVIGCGTVGSRREAIQRAQDLIDRTERRRIIRRRLLAALQALPPPAAANGWSDAASPAE